MNAYPVPQNTKPNTDVGMSLDDAMKELAKASAKYEDPLLNAAFAALLDARTLMQEKNQRIAFLESLSTTDELTQILNRRGFETQCRQALAAGQRYGESGAMLMIDLDDFKVINDTLGHQAGDAVLRTVAAVLRAETRSSDIVARVGGDEFAIFLPRTRWKDAMNRADQLKARLQNLTVLWNDHELTVSASVGIAAYTPGTTLAVLENQADAAMYEAKTKTKAERRLTVRNHRIA